MGLTDKKRAIFEAMLDLVASYGFHGASMSSLSREAGVAAGTIYHYFASKDLLMNELYTYCKGQVEDWVQAELDEGQPYKERFYKRWLSLYAFYTAHPKVLVFFEQYINSPYNQERSPHHFRGGFFHFLKEGMDDGHLKKAKPELYVSLYMGSVILAAKIRIFGSIEIDVEDRNLLISKLWTALTRA
ncbi:TetR/AcrR family transcriptional regulator [Cyclobacterium lianum]|nr:TetR/AcrR family transcriptional regulator [Cyclobacterium lianum]